MEISFLDLRRNPEKILKALRQRERVKLSRRGKAVGYIVPADEAGSMESATATEAFGMWQDVVKPVDEVVRDLRKPRVHDL